MGLAVGTDNVTDTFVTFHWSHLRDKDSQRVHRLIVMRLVKEHNVTVWQCDHMVFKNFAQHLLDLTQKFAKQK